MEDPCLAIVEENEDFYERIEAPKFVDFTIPDCSRPDRRSWFCSRVGCDQNHEEVDPNELNRSFMLRVMTARSPNVRFQRVLNKQCSRANTKCPQSAPAKSIKNGVSRMTTMNSITEKITMAKLKQHPMARLRETPIQKRERVHTLTGEKEQTTTGNNKSQARYLKTSDTVAASKDRNLVKALFSHTPRKAAGSSKAPISEICSEKKKKMMSTNGVRKHMIRGSCATSSGKCKGSSISSTKTRAVGSKHRNHIIFKEAKHSEIGVVSNGSDHVEEKNNNLAKPTGEELQAIIESKIENDFDVLIRPGKDEVQYIDLKISSGAVSEIKTACNAMNGDDKENTPFTFENQNIHPNAASSSKEAKVQNKALQGGVKLTRTTNPKPFRLRTDERGILKEANLERKKLQVESKKEPAALLTHVDGIQIQETHSQAKLAKTTQTRMLNSKRESLKIASTKQPLKITSSAKERKESISRMFKEKGALIKPPDNRSAERRRPGCHLRGRKPATIPKEPKFHRIHDAPKNCIRRKPATIPKDPKFHRIHVPKNCIRRFEMAVS